MKIRTSTIIMILLSILNVVLVGLVCYYYSLHRWATGTIYFLIILSSILFTLVGIIENHESRLNRREGEELKVYKTDKQLGCVIPGFEDYKPNYKVRKYAKA